MTNTTDHYRLAGPLALVILDGWGLAPRSPYNAISTSNTPFFNSLLQRHPHCQLQASGEAVGLPAGTVGGSEVGHYTIGAGRIIKQDLTQINSSIQDQSFFHEPAFLRAIQHVKNKKSSLHIIGLFSDGGVHADIHHLYALLKLAKQHNLKQVFIHVIADGRDVPPQSIKKYLKTCDKQIKKIGIGKIASVIGRYFAMDRDHNWQRTEKAYRLLVKGIGHKFPTASAGVDFYYQAGCESDYYLEPIIITDAHDKPLATIKNHDAVIFYNYRSDRALQLTHAFTNSRFDHFERPRLKIFFVCMTHYSDHLQAHTAFPRPKIKQCLSAVLAKHHLHQLRIAETEKFAHVTYFFNTQQHQPFAGEDHILINSYKVKSFAKRPEMRASSICHALERSLVRDSFDFIVLNFANADLVGHSGDLTAMKLAIRTIDQSLQKICHSILSRQGVVLVTADHGNAEQMQLDHHKNPSHTSNPVPFILVSNSPTLNKIKLSNGGLANIAATVLDLLGISTPSKYFPSLIKKTPPTK